MNRRTLLGALAGTAVAIPVLSACSSGVTSLDGGGSSGGGSASSKNGVTIGTANFTENQVLGYLYAAALEAAACEGQGPPQPRHPRDRLPRPPERRHRPPPRVPGPLLTYLQPKSKVAEAGEMQNALTLALPSGLQVLPYGVAEDADCFVVTRATARKYGLTSLADLAKHNGKLTLGASAEVKTRQVGVVGLKSVYGVELREFKSLDSDGPLVKGALKKGDVDVANLFTTDTDIKANDWVVLTDPKTLIPSQHIVPLVADRVADPTVRKALARLGNILTTAQLTELNRQVDKDKKDPEDVANTYAEQHGITK